MSEIRFQKIWKRYPDGHEAVKDLNLGIADLVLDITHIKLFDKADGRSLIAPR